MDEVLGAAVACPDRGARLAMIIDIHAHVSAPEGLYAYQANLLASRGGQRKAMYAADDEKVEAALKAHLKFLEEAGTDLQLLSPRPYTMMHHEKPDKIVHWYIASCNNRSEEHTS